MNWQPLATRSVARDVVHGTSGRRKDGRRVCASLGMVLMIAALALVPAEAVHAQDVCAAGERQVDFPAGEISSHTVLGGVEAVRIIAAGGKGGDGVIDGVVGGVGGPGAVLTGTVAVTEGQELRVLVGTAGRASGGGGGGGGGGASFVGVGSDFDAFSQDNLLVAAGGGGGGVFAGPGGVGGPQTAVRAGHRTGAVGAVAAPAALQAVPVAAPVETRRQNKTDRVETVTWHAVQEVAAPVAREVTVSTTTPVYPASAARMSIDNLQVLHHAVLVRSPEMVRLLMEHGANAREGVYPHRDATTAHAIALQRDYDEIVRIIEEQEQKQRNVVSGVPNAPAADDLFRAIASGDTERAIALMKEHPVQIHTRHIPSEASPLHAAAQALDAPLVTWLLDHGADPRTRMHHDLTPSTSRHTGGTEQIRPVSKPSLGRCCVAAPR